MKRVSPGVADDRPEDDGTIATDEEDFDEPTQSKADTVNFLSDPSRVKLISAQTVASSINSIVEILDEGLVQGTSIFCVGSARLLIVLVWRRQIYPDRGDAYT